MSGIVKQETELRLMPADWSMRDQAEIILLKHLAENQEKDLGLCNTDVIVNAMIEFKNMK
jgi:hypothetical protein